MYADRLENAIHRTGAPLCLGLDPFVDLMPEAFCRQRDHDPLRCSEDYLLGALETVQGRVPVVKPQSAFFEQYGATGFALFESLCRRAQAMGFLVIADVKRGDIGSTAAAYASAYAELADAVTVNPYLGHDGIKPFIETARQNEGGVYVLVRTSNPSAGDFQDLRDAQGRCLYESVAERVRLWGEDLNGPQGSSLGAVVGATWPAQGQHLRALMPDTPFLIPGYGAQGGTVEGVAACRRPDGKGILVNSSRALLYAWREQPEISWQQALDNAMTTMIQDVKG